MSMLPKPPITPLVQTGRAWLFLDYDGTLADFAPNPDILAPDHELITLIQSLVAHPSLRVAVISGRRLHHASTLLPVPGLILAGVYGIEQQTPTGEEYFSVTYEDIRPTIERVKKAWEQIIDGHPGFYLEDKGYALAIHARLALDADVPRLLASAETYAEHNISEQDFMILGGHRFLEIAPRTANKGATVNYLWNHYPLEGAKPVYIGDDDKDEAGFRAVRDLGGWGVVVADTDRSTAAVYRLKFPPDVRAWLNELGQALSTTRGFDQS